MIRDKFLQEFGIKFLAWIGVGPDVLHVFLRVSQRTTRLATRVDVLQRGAPLLSDSQAGRARTVREQELVQESPQVSGKGKAGKSV